MLCALLVFAAVMGWITHHRDTEAAKALRTQLADIRAHYTTDSTRWARQRSQLEAERLQLVQDGARLARRLTIAQDTARKALSALAALLAAQGHDTSIVGDVEAAFETCQETITNLSGQVANCETRVAVADSSAAVAVRLAGSYETAWRDAESRARPSLLRDLWRSKAVWAPLLALLAALSLIGN